jgi:hypothetical protein
MPSNGGGSSGHPLRPRERESGAVQQVHLHQVQARKHWIQMQYCGGTSNEWWGKMVIWWRMGQCGGSF